MLWLCPRVSVARCSCHRGACTGPRAARFWIGRADPCGYAPRSAGLAGYEATVAENLAADHRSPYRARVGGLLFSLPFCCYWPHRGDGNSIKEYDCRSIGSTQNEAHSYAIRSIGDSYTPVIVVMLPLLLRQAKSGNQFLARPHAFSVFSLA